MTVIDQKRIAKNTLMLAIRMGLMTVVKLYTVKVVMDALGNVDYGIFNTVAGVVLTFSFINDTMSTACQRFLAIGMGKNDYVQVRNTFSLCIMVFLAIALVVALLCETGGLVLLHNKIQLDGRSMSTAHTVFQLAIISFIFTIIKTPYHGMVIMKEKMNVYTYISIIEVLGNLGTAVLIAHSDKDRLIIYSLLMMLVNAMVSLTYVTYCNVRYKECRFKYYWNWTEFKEILYFVTWNMFGSLAISLKSYGLNVLINIFFGNIVVSARTLAFKVYGILLEFSGNITTAVRPQIIKSYSAGDKEGMFKLIFQGSKFSYYLFLIVSLPLFLEMPFVLNLWIDDVPEYTVLFTRLCIINGLFDVLVTPLAVSMQAYGKIRTYQLVCSFFIMSVIPISYIFLKLGFPPQTVFYVSIIICALAIVLRVLFINHYIGLPVGGYFWRVMIPMVMVTAISAVIPAILEMTIDNTILRFFTVCATAVIMICISAYTIGMTVTERKHATDYIKNLLQAKKR